MASVGDGARTALFVLLDLYLFHYTCPKSSQAERDTSDSAGTLEGAEEKKEETDGNIQVIQFLVQKKTH